MIKHEKVDREIIDGKPYFGLQFGNYIFLNEMAFEGDLETNDWFQLAKRTIEKLPKKALDAGEIRYKEIIVRRPYYSTPLMARGTIGIKYVVWGRAFRVMKILAKNKPYYKKLRRGGRLKWVKLNKKVGK
jgi:hypothetical protein